MYCTSVLEIVYLPCVIHPFSQTSHFSTFCKWDTSSPLESKNETVHWNLGDWVVKLLYLEKYPFLLNPKKRIWVWYMQNSFSGQKINPLFGIVVLAAAIAQQPSKLQSWRSALSWAKRIWIPRELHIEQQCKITRFLSCFTHWGRTIIFVQKVSFW